MTTVDNNNDNNNDTNSAEEFEIDVDAIYTMASLAREWFVAHESGTDALTILKEAKEELSSMLKKKKKKEKQKENKKNEDEDFSSSPYHVKVQEKIKSILPSDDMLNCLMKRGKYANFFSAADAERVDEACEKLRRIVEELESISKRMEETFESFTSAFENGGKEVKEEAKNPPEHLARRDEEKEEGHGRQGRDREPRGRRRSRSRSSRGRDRRRGREADQKEDEAEEAVVLAKLLSFLETTKKEETDDEAPSPKVHWMHNVPNAALSTRFSLSNTTAEINNNNNNKRSFEQWLFLCASALEGTRKELRVKQVVAEKALDSLRGSFSSSNTTTSNSTRSHTEEREEKEDNNGVLLFDSLLDAWDVQAFVDDDAFRALSSESVE